LIKKAVYGSILNSVSLKLNGRNSSGFTDSDFSLLKDARALIVIALKVAIPL